MREDKKNKSKYQIFPDLLPDEYESLKSSIAVRGVDFPIVVDQDGEIIDGFHRQHACDELGIFCPREARQFDSDAERLELAVTANCKRRQLNREQKHALVAAYLKVDPTVNNNILAELIGISRNTVVKVRSELERTHQIAKLTEFRGRDGKTRPRNYARIIANSPTELKTALEVIKDVPANGRTLDVTTAARRARRRVKKAEREGQVITPLPDDAIKLYNCQFQQLEQVAGIGPGSVHAIITDPPYGKDFLPHLPDLAAFAARTLVDGGLFVMHSGQYYLNQVMHGLDQHLTYRWMIASVWAGDANMVHPLDLASQWKPILICSKGDWRRRDRWNDLSRIGGKEKNVHEWQQSLAEVETLVRYFSNPGDLVIDPCGGGFTTALACRNLGRRCISCDIDEQAVLAGQQRLAAPDEQSSLRAS